MTQTIFDRIAALGVVPVITIDHADQALALADALLEGGLPVAEITFRTAAAGEVIAALAKARPELLTGAGTILDIDSLVAARDAGARFSLAPGFDPRITAAAREIDMPFAPGLMTPSELSLAIADGLSLFKFFPAQAAGGPSTLSAISAPFSHQKPRFIPTGGISPTNMGQWFSIPTVAAVGGTWIATREDIANGDFAAITIKARDAVAAVARLREEHS